MLAAHCHTVRRYLCRLGRFHLAWPVHARLQSCTLRVVGAQITTIICRSVRLNVCMEAGEGIGGFGQRRHLGWSNKRLRDRSMCGRHAWICFDCLCGKHHACAACYTSLLLERELQLPRDSQILNSKFLATRPVTSRGQLKSNSRNNRFEKGRVRA
jgi:hypothetical protein